MRIFGEQKKTAIPNKVCSFSINETKNYTGVSLPAKWAQPNSLSTTKQDC
jgi:hypothetical protein